jgi:hypothetical protein
MSTTCRDDRRRHGIREYGIRSVSARSAAPADDYRIVTRHEAKISGGVHQTSAATSATVNAAATTTCHYQYLGVAIVGNRERTVIRKNMDTVAVSRVRDSAASRRRRRRGLRQRQQNHRDAFDRDIPEPFRERSAIPVRDDAVHAVFPYATVSRWRL